MPERADNFVQVCHPVSVVRSDAAGRAAGLFAVVAVDVDLAVRVSVAGASVERHKVVGGLGEAMLVSAADAKQRSALDA